MPRGCGSDTAHPFSFLLDPMKNVVFSALVVLSVAVLSLPAQDRPNIVFVVTDDQGYGDLGHTGNPVIRTPHLDALAAESSKLTDFHVAPTCHQVCHGIRYQSRTYGHVSHSA